MGTNGVAAGVGASRSMRVRRLAAVVLAGLLPGCSGWGIFLEPAPQFIGVETWTDVPQGKEAVAAKVGDVLHFPLGPGAASGPSRIKLPVQFDVTVNGERPADPQYLVTLAAVTFVFRAQEPGRYHIEVTRFVAGGHDKPPLAWDVAVSE